jgi:hypothetical protein
MLIKNVVMEAGITYCETCKLSSVPIRIPAALYSCRYQTILKELFIEEACVAA